MARKSVFIMSKQLKLMNFNDLFVFISRTDPAKIPWKKLGIFFHLDLNDVFSIDLCLFRW